MDSNYPSSFANSNIYFSHIIIYLYFYIKENSKDKIQSADKAKSEDEINKLINCLMSNKKYITFEDFKEATLNQTSDLFILVNYFIIIVRFIFF